MKNLALLLVASGCLIGMPLAAQKRVPYAFAHQGIPPKEAQLKLLTEVTKPGSSFLRLYFKGTQLGETSYLLLEAPDGARQELRAADLQNWNYSSAYFNGGRVKVSLFAAAGEKNTVRVSEIKVTDEQAELARNARQAAGTLGTPPPTLAFTAMNVTETHPYSKAVGRFTNGSNSFGTGWIAPNGAIVTSRDIYLHTVRDSGYDIIEFNVPPSVGGKVKHPAPDDQYPLNPATVPKASDLGSVLLGLKGGDDVFMAGWGILEALPNSTGLRPGERLQQNLRIATNPGSFTIDAQDGVPVDLFHYGSLPSVGPSPLMRTLQRMETTLLEQSRFNTGSNSDQFVFYNASALLGFNEDRTVGSDAGAPITYRNSDVAIGVHNLSLQTLSSFGMGFSNNAFRNGLARFFSSNAVYVDPEGVYDPGTGEIDKPFRTENKAASDAPAGAQVYFARGEYRGPSTFNRPMTMRAPVGKVVMGVPFSSARKAAGPTISPQLLAEGPSPSFDRESAEEHRVGASPNPFREAVTVSYQLAAKGPVTVAVYNISGAEVARLVSGEAEAGSHTARWGGTDHTGTPVAPGLYFVKVNSGNQTFTTKVLKQ